MDPDQSALVQGLFGAFGGSGNYLDPQRATPQQIQAQLAWGNSQLNRQTDVHRPMEGVAELVRSLVGGNAVYQANQAQQGAIANVDQQKQALIQGLQNGASAPPSPAGSASSDGLPSPQQAADSYAQGAQARGIDPNVALKVFGGESNFNVAAAGDPDASGHNTSFGVSQLHYGSAGGGPNSGKGMGDEFTAATGLDARDPRNWQAVRDFTLDKVKAGGWGPWHAAQRAGIGNFDGIGGGSPAGGASASAPNGFTHPTAQALAAYKAPIDPKLAADIMSNPWQDEATKSLVMQALNPSIVEDSMHNRYYAAPGGNGVTPVRGMAPGVVVGDAGAGGAHAPTYTTQDPATGKITSTQPGGGAALKDLGKTGGEIEATNRNLVGDAEGDMHVVNAAKGAAYDAQATLGPLKAAADQAQKAGYGVIPNLQAIAGHYGISTEGLSDIQAFKKVAGAVAASDPVLGSRLASALPTMEDNPAARQAIMNNLLAISQRQADMGKLAYDDTKSVHDRAKGLSNFPLPQPAAPPTAAPPAAPVTAPAATGGAPHAGTFSSADDALAQARAAIASGRPRAAVESRLRQVGIDPGKL